VNSQVFATYDIPDVPGIYFFKKNKDILYIGRATSLRDRLRSYFASDLIETRGPLIVDMVFNADEITWTETGSVLEAIILEASEIRKHQPVYNTKEKDDKSFNWVVLTKEAFPAVRIVRGRELAQYEAKTKKSPFPIGKTFGPFPSGTLLKEALRIVRRIFPYRDERCVPGSGRPCFNRQIGLCPGVCTGEITLAEYKIAVNHIVLFLSGKSRALRELLVEEMRHYADHEHFENASAVKHQIEALSHIHDVSLLKRDNSMSVRRARTRAIVGTRSLSRIEAYDIAHLGGSGAVGVMAVVVDGEVDTSQFRTFKLKNTIPGDDTGGLKEILSRRLLHEEWGLPDMVVVDGSIPHIKVAQIELARVGLSRVPVVAVTKDEKHRPKKLVGDKAHITENEATIILANAEAHRFALARHRRGRRIVR
jgi:excinuclease ABC subunit C